MEPIIPGSASLGTVSSAQQPPHMALEWREGDTAREAIDRVGGLSPEALAEFAYLWRKGEAPDSGGVPVRVNLNDGTAGSIPLYPGDLLDIPYREEWVAVTGAVHIPGRYPYVAGWTAGDYIHAAGGASTIGKHSGWKVRRAGRDQQSVTLNDLVFPGDVLFVPQSRTHKMSVLLATASSATALLISIIALTSSN
jgi:protein involved in polysaccharide export with SLBB domain